MALSDTQIQDGLAAATLRGDGVLLFSDLAEQGLTPARRTATASSCAQP